MARNGQRNGKMGYRTDATEDRQKGTDAVGGMFERGAGSRQAGRREMSCRRCMKMEGNILWRPRPGDRPGDPRDTAARSRNRREPSGGNANAALIHLRQQDCGRVYCCCCGRKWVGSSQGEGWADSRRMAKAKAMARGVPCHVVW